MIKARVFHMCQVAAGDFQGVYIDVELPVLPPVGSLLKLTPKGDYLVVEGVMIDITTGGEGIGVQIKEPEHDAEIWPWGEMRAEGWCTTEVDPMRA